MALSSLLDIVTRACDEMALARPTNIIAATDRQTQQMLALLNTAGRDLMASHQWAALVATASITTATSSVNYTLPTDFDRLVDDASWDRTNQFPMMGSITPQRHQYWLSSGSVAPTTRKEFRVHHIPGSSTVTVVPTPTSAEALLFFYVRNTWALSGSTPIEEFAADTNTTIFKPQLLVKELKWRWKSAKGLASTDLMLERDRYYDYCVAADIGARALDMAGPNRMEPIDYLNIPDANWQLT